VEGNYVLFNEPPWNDLSAMFDVKVFLHCTVEVATERLVKRHVKAWAITEEAARRRVETNDKLNFELVDAKRCAADLTLANS
jgi:pantothenate kinase